MFQGMIRRRAMPRGVPRAEQWERVLHIIDQTYSEYEAGLKELRRRVVAGTRRKVRESKVPRGRAR